MLIHKTKAIIMLALGFSAKSYSVSTATSGFAGI